jgi:chorismate-pyruvate lyase
VHLVRPLLVCLTIALSHAMVGTHGSAQGLPTRPAPAWSDSFLSRVEALALMQSLNAEILASTSSTTTLEKWCRDHRLADDPRIVARRMTGVEQPPTVEQRQRLEVTPGERVKHRRVQLVCGSRVLSVADNWYVPGRLTSEMNQELDTTDAPFGKVVRPLEPYRRTFAARVLWRPLPEGWELGGRALEGTASGRLDIPDALFEHQAVLYTSKQRPFAEVNEVYQRGILAFPQPR